MRTNQAEIQARKSVLGAIMFGRGRHEYVKGRKEKNSLSWKVREKQISSSTKKTGMQRLQRDFLVNGDVFGCLPA